MLDLQTYLDRIGYLGAVRPNLKTLVDIHRAQALSVPYEAIDVLNGVPLDQDIERIFGKIVSQRRGGWCYETNGILGWALKEAGFKVRRAVAGVYRKDKGDSTLGNHVVLLVDLGKTYLADLGLGDALRAPLELREGLHQQGCLTFKLEKLPDGCWRLHNHKLGTPTSFDFRDVPADEALLTAKCAALQVDPESFFVQNFECILMKPESSVAILGRVLRFTSAQGVEKQLLGSPDHMQEVLAQHFGLTGIGIASMWPKILERHRLVFGGEDELPD